MKKPGRDPRLFFYAHLQPYVLKTAETCEKASILPYNRF